MSDDNPPEPDRDVLNHEPPRPYILTPGPRPLTPDPWPLTPGP